MPDGTGLRSADQAWWEQTWLVLLLGIPPNHLEDAAAYVRRRGRHASAVQAETGAWSRKHM